MAEKNPFALDQKKLGKAAPKQYKAKTYTEEDKNDLLTGYIEVPEDLWPFVRYGTHVRYVTKADEFRPGGFVLRNPFDTKPRGEAVEKRFIKLQNGFNAKIYGYAEWVVAYEDLKHLYAKPDALMLTMQRMIEDVVKGFNERNRKVAEYVKKLEKRIATLEAKQ
jgi:hypothetical protein